MKVILTQDVRGKGKRGQMIEVSDGLRQKLPASEEARTGGKCRQHQYHAHER